MARTRHGLGKRLALRLITVVGFAAAAWAIGSGSAHASAPDAAPQPSLVTVLDELLGDVLGTPQEQASPPLRDTATRDALRDTALRERAAREKAVPRARIVPMKPFHRPYRHVASRPVLVPSEDADPVTSIVVPLLSPVINAVVAVTEPVVRVVEPVAEPFFAIPLTQALKLNRAVGEAFVAIITPGADAAARTLAPGPDTAVRALAAERSRTTVDRRATATRVHIGKLGRVHRVTSGNDRSVEGTGPDLPLTEPLGGRTPMDASALTAPGGAQAGVLPAAPELAEPGEIALRSAAHRAAERMVGDAPTSSPD